jgi:hypothetical protein
LFIDNQISFIDKEGIPMPSVAVLPRLFRWLFTALELFCLLGAIIISCTILIDPHLPQGTHFGPFNIDFAGQPGSVELRAVENDSDFTVTAFRGDITVVVEKAGGLIEVAKQYGLPAILIGAVFFIVLFDLLRRLFRNVSRGDSFTRQSVTFVQLLGVSILIYAVLSAFAERWFAHAMLAYLSQHALITISGTSLHLPAPAAAGFSITFNGTLIFAGLLVLALAEVFRQGLTLKSEHDLTV